MPLCICSGCARHVKQEDAACPFCGATIVGAGRSPGSPWRKSRAAALIGVAAVAVACGGSTTEPTDGGADAAGLDAAKDSSIDGPLVFYGGPPLDAAPPQDAADEGPIAAYGGPPTDAGTD